MFPTSVVTVAVLERKRFLLVLFLLVLHVPEMVSKCNREHTQEAKENICNSVHFSLSFFFNFNFLFISVSLSPLLSVPVQLARFSFQIPESTHPSLPPLPQISSSPSSSFSLPPPVSGRVNERNSYNTLFSNWYQDVPQSIRLSLYLTWNLYVILSSLSFSQTPPQFMSFFSLFHCGTAPSPPPPSLPLSNKKIFRYKRRETPVRAPSSSLLLLPPLRPTLPPQLYIIITLWCGRIFFSF